MEGNDAVVLGKGTFIGSKSSVFRSSLLYVYLKETFGGHCNQILSHAIHPLPLVRPSAESLLMYLEEIGVE